MKTPLLFATLAIFAAAQLRAAGTDVATNAVNALGIDLLKGSGKPDENALLSPYSIQNALAMAYAEAGGKTRAEMAAALHFPMDGSALDKSFAALANELEAIHASSRKAAANSYDGPKDPVTITVANRLYGQEGYDFRGKFLADLKENYGAPLEQADFRHAADDVRRQINAWVGEQTHKRIQNVIPEGALDGSTRLVLVNAIYFKAGWSDRFYTTDPAPFHANGGRRVDVPTMSERNDYGYARRDGYTAVSIPYIGYNLQFLVLLPDRANGLAALESKLTPALLADCAKLKTANVYLWLPKFKMEPEPMRLSGQLEALGMRTAFNEPEGSADFDGIAPREPGKYLYISEVFHKTFLSLDEYGTEAAAVTEMDMPVSEGVEEAARNPHVVHVDHPFIFAIQDCKSGACLFLGRMNDPR